MRKMRLPFIDIDLLYRGALWSRFNSFLYGRVIESSGYIWLERTIRKTMIIVRNVWLFTTSNRSPLLAIYYSTSNRRPLLAIYYSTRNRRPLLAIYYSLGAASGCLTNDIMRAMHNWVFLLLTPLKTNISVISWRLVLLVEERRILRVSH